MLERDCQEWPRRSHLALCAPLLNQAQRHAQWILGKLTDYLVDNCSVYVKKQADHVEVFLEMSASGEVFLGPGPAGSRLSVQGHGVQ